MPKIHWRGEPARRRVRRYPSRDNLTRIPLKRKKLKKYPYTGKGGVRRPQLEEFFDEKIQAEDERKRWGRELAERDRGDYSELSVEVLKFRLNQDEKNLEVAIKNKKVPSDIRWIVLLEERIKLLKEELENRKKANKW